MCILICTYIFVYTNVLNRPSYANPKVSLNSASQQNYFKLHVLGARTGTGTHTIYSKLHVLGARTGTHTMEVTSQELKLQT